MERKKEMWQVKWCKEDDIQIGLVVDQFYQLNQM